MHTKPVALVVFATVLFAAPLSADWVTLQDGTDLKGIDLKKHGKGFRFTLENGEAVFLPAGSIFYYEKSTRDETVEFRGSQVSLRDKIQTLQREQRERTRKAVRSLERWARGGAGPKGQAGAEAARRVFESLSEKERLRAFEQALGSSEINAARRLAATELSRYKDPTALRALARGALRDDFRSVRDTCLASLKKLDDPKTPDFFIPHLRNKEPRARIRAANALSVFPARRAVPELIDTLHMAWTGFGNAYMMQVTQRAYVADYELVSGGTGFSIVEVADPVIRTALTGVALDVKVRRVELTARLRALHKATGQDFGTDVQKWRQWWKLEQQGQN